MYAGLGALTTYLVWGAYGTSGDEGLEWRESSLVGGAITFVL